MLWLISVSIYLSGVLYVGKVHEIKNQKPVLYR